MDDSNREDKDPGAGGPAAKALLPLVYDELRSLARRYMREERLDHTLEPTALVHEAYLRMARIERVQWQGKTHFFAVAATQMRRVLVEHARRSGSKKRGERPHRVTLSEGLIPTPESTVCLLDLDDALSRLEHRSSRQARAAELRIFAGMTFAEIGRILQISERTAKRDWFVSRAWLALQLERSASGSA